MTNFSTLSIREEKAILENVKRSIKSLDLPRLFRFEYLVDKISNSVKQEIELVPCNMKNETTGIIVTGENIHIFFEASVSPIHQIQIKLHELGHIALGHGFGDFHEENYSIVNSFYASLKSYKNLQTITMKRQNYDEKSEKEAELFATELLERIRLDTVTTNDPIFSIMFE